MDEKRLTNEEYEQQYQMYEQFDERNDGATTYLKTFVDEQDRLEHNLHNSNKIKRKKPYMVEVLEKELAENPNNDIIDKKLLESEFGTMRNNKSTFSFCDLTKDILTSPFTLVQNFFKWYIEDITLLKGITLFFFMFTTIFCGWIAFLKLTELFCIFVSCYTPFYVLSPFDSADYFPWIVLGVVWVLPFLIHFFGKYVFVWIPLVVIGLVLIELLIGDSMFTDAFIALIEGLTNKL